MHGMSYRFALGGSDMKRVFFFSRTTILTAAAVLATVVAITAPADAAPIRFDNPTGPGHFEWNASPGQEFLDILAGPNSQPGLSDAPGVFRRQNTNTGTLVRGAISSSQLQYVRLDTSGGGFAFFATGVDHLDPVPTTGIVDGFRALGFVFRPDVDPFPVSGFSEGEQSYLGVQFDLGNGIQYGWIGLVRAGQEVDAFAWGYETEPGVPIAAGVPEPGTLSLLALGSADLLRRRRRARVKHEEARRRKRPRSSIDLT